MRGAFALRLACVLLALTGACVGAPSDAQVSATSPTAPLVRAHTPAFGAADAKVHIVEFLDPACEGCRAVHPVVKQLIAENRDRIRLWVRYVPQHRGADFAVKALEAARAQRRFGESLDVLYDRQDEWTRQHVVVPQQVLYVLSSVNGLDMDRLRRDMENPAFARMIEQDMADAQALRIVQTPAVFINGKPLTEYSFAALRAQVRQEVVAQYP